MADLLTIGEVADRAGVATSTLRYYDDIDLLTPATRISGQRRYTPAALHRLAVIADCQRAGFSLEEIGRLLDGGTDWQRLARRKREELEERIAALREARRLVDAALACGCEDLEGCERSSHAGAGAGARAVEGAWVDEGPLLTDPTRPAPSQQPPRDGRSRS